MKVSEIASWLGLPVEGDGGLNILQAAPLDTAPADIAFALPRKAGREPPPRTRVASSSPRTSTTPRSGPLSAPATRAPRSPRGRAPASTGATPARRPSNCAGRGDGHDRQDVSIGPFAVVSEEAAIGDRTAIGAHCFIGSRRAHRADSTLHARVTCIHSPPSARARSCTPASCSAPTVRLQPNPARLRKIPANRACSPGRRRRTRRQLHGGSSRARATEIGDARSSTTCAHRPQLRIGRHVLIVAQTGVGGAR